VLTPDFRLLFETSPSLLLVVDRELNLLAATDGYLRATHTERAAIIGRNVFEVFPSNPHDETATGAESLRQSLEYVLNTGRSDRIELLKYDIQVAGEDGPSFEERYWSVLNAPMLGADGRLAMIVQRVQDVTERVLQQRQQERSLQLEIEQRTRAVEALHKTEEQLRESELRATRDALEHARNVFNRFFTLSLDLMCICGTDGYFRRVNPAFMRLGHSEEELLSAPMVSFMHPEDRVRTQVNLRKLEAGENTTGSENRYRCKDGSYRWIAWNSTPEGDGTIYAIGRDITEAKRASEELRQAKVVAESANRELESFSYTVAHDLRAPLRSIDGFSLALLEDYEDKLDEEGKGYLGRLRSGSQRMAQLIDDLLALSRLSRGELQLQTIDLTQIARGVLERLRETYRERNVEAQVADGLTARGDARLIANALENLLGNAWKFTAKTEHAKIEVGVGMENGERAFFVRDNGAGFDMTFAHKLFGAFQRLHTTTEFEGNGIGLASVQRIIHRHGGRIWAQAAVGEGAWFHFTLPST
jgi:PAS domain S-box-containing protein